MPTQTFFNLTDEKRTKIIDAAKKEFQQNSFYDASINKIIKEAGISRGSFYMYFENKEDLFIFLMDEFRRAMVEKIVSDNKGVKYDIFSLSLAVFDYVTTKQLHGKENFMINTFKTFDSELFSHFINLKNDEANLSLLKKYVDTDKLNVKNDKELIYISEIVMSTISIEVIFVCGGKNTPEEARKRIIKKFEFIRNGTDIK